MRQRPPSPRHLSDVEIEAWFELEVAKLTRSLTAFYALPLEQQTQLREVRDESWLIEEAALEAAERAEGDSIRETP